MSKKKDTSSHYIDNKKFYDEICKYKQKCREYEAAGKEQPRLPEYLGQCLWLIATRLVTKGNFYGYPFRDEMVGDGIINCLKYFTNFDETKYKNPLAYYTQITWFAFLRRIDIEKKQLYAKYKSMENSNMMNLTSAVQDHDKQVYADFIKQSEGSADYMAEFIQEFENTKADKAKKKT